MRELRKIATVLEELKAKIQQRNCIAEVIETMQNSNFDLQLNFGYGHSDGFQLQVPEMYIPIFKSKEFRNFHEQAKKLYLDYYKAELMQVIKDIAALEIEEVNILHTLAKPLQDHELSQN